MARYPNVSRLKIVNLMVIQKIDWPPGSEPMKTKLSVWQVFFVNRYLEIDKPSGYHCG